MITLVFVEVPKHSSVALNGVAFKTKNKQTKTCTIFLSCNCRQEEELKYAFFTITSVYCLPFLQHG